jgi:hypothetical protein
MILSKPTVKPWKQHLSNLEQPYLLVGEKTYITITGMIGQPRHNQEWCNKEKKWSKVFTNLTGIEIKMAHHTMIRKDNCTSVTATNPNSTPFKPTTDFNILTFSIPCWYILCVRVAYISLPATNVCIPHSPFKCCILYQLSMWSGGICWTFFLLLGITSQFYALYYLPKAVDNFPNFKYNEASIHCCHMCHFPTNITHFFWSQKIAHINNVYLYRLYCSSKCHFPCQ